eukprot:1723812-Pyramimonas_sp.AAC.1
MHGVLDAATYSDCRIEVVIGQERRDDRVSGGGVASQECGVELCPRRCRGARRGATRSRGRSGPW